MDPVALHSHWLGNCYVHVGATDAVCSYRHEPGRAKTWRKSRDQGQQQGQPQDQEDAVSVDPVCPSPKKNTNTKDHVRIIQLQKKNLVLRTDLDALKSEFKDLKAELSTVKAELSTVKAELSTVKAELSTVKAEHVALAQRHKEQEAGTKRANQCMQDWTNQQVIERIRILEQTQQTQQMQQMNLNSCV
jgi:predicted RNase H-like nuclease (RuvC/YqgF family)